MRLCIVFVFVLLCAGCGAHKVILPSYSNGGSVIDQKAMKRSKSLAILPFKPGPGTVANDDTDHVSQTLINGIKDGLKLKGQTYRIEDNARKADLVLEGYIEELDKKHMAIDGDIWVSNTTKALTFWANAEIPKKTIPADVAYDAGQAIAQYIVDHQ